MRALKALSTLLLLGTISQPFCAIAQTAKAEGVAPMGDIVVTANRRGEAKVPAESEFDENAIAAQGVDSIQELLTRLSPLIGDGADAPVILINGRPAGFDRSILAYPAEALTRLAILKPEAAATYGASPGKRVVNLVLKPRFASLDTEAAGNWATGGGQYGGSLSVGRVAIVGDMRWNIQARIGGDTALLKNARRIPPAAGSFDSVGYISAANGGEIDPALSVAAGQVVTAAAIPARAISIAPSIEDFVATANETHPLDPNAFDTLQPSRRTIGIDAGVAHPFGAFSVSLNLDASSSSDHGLRGMPMASVAIPAGSAWSPFAEDLVLTRPFAGAHGLRNDNSAKMLGGSLTLAGLVGGWQGSLSFSYRRNWTDSLLESGVDVARIQQLIDGGDTRFNPYGVWNKSLLLSTRNRTRGENLSARLNIQKKIVDLAAGPLAWNFIADANRVRTDSQQSDNSGAVTMLDDATRSQFNAQMSVNAPLSARREERGLNLGDLSVDLWIGGQLMTKTTPQTRLGGGLNWSPIKAMQLLGTVEFVETAPSLDQLAGPIVQSVNRVFDYTRQEIAQPIWTTGGNPDLQRGNRQTVAFSALVRPFGGQSLSLNLGYRQTIAKGGVAPFPELSPIVEAMFPERVTRDVSGRLVAVDARAINMTRDTDSDLTSGIAWRYSGAARGGPGMQLGDPIQLNVSANYRLRLKSEMLIRPGLPVIDRLGGGIGTSRHLLNLQLNAGKRGAGVNLAAIWSSPARVDQSLADPKTALRVTPPTILNLSIFVNPDQLFPRLRDSAFTKGLKISLSVQNLLNDYRRVKLSDGSIPAGFSHDEVDPLGRSMRLTVRKRF